MGRKGQGLLASKVSRHDISDVQNVTRLLIRVYWAHVLIYIYSPTITYFHFMEDNLLCSHFQIKLWCV